jgi:hypothetical protein
MSKPLKERQNVVFVERNQMCVIIIYVIWLGITHWLLALVRSSQKLVFEGIL